MGDFFACVGGVHIPRLTLACILVSLLLPTAGVRGAAPASAAPPAAARPLPRSGQPYENGLAMKFVPVKGISALVGIWTVRVQDYEAFVLAAGRKWEKPAYAQGPTHPAVNLSWEDAQTFCRWLTQREREAGRLGPGQTYRLPTDAEWSIAAGLDEPLGGTPQSKDQKIKDVYLWGAAWPPPKDSGNYDGSLRVDTFEHTSPVGSFAASPNGLYDLSGNVWQWCEDLFDATSGRRTVRGSAYYNVAAENLLLSRRNAYDPASRALYIGFRLVLDLGTAAP
jgi:formylglycine-generating enzyme required for sulfatase activity